MFELDECFKTLSLVRSFQVGIFDDFQLKLFILFVSLHCLAETL